MSEDTDYRIVSTRDDFSKLIALLKIFENSCTDCDIRNGRYRCRTDNRLAVIDMDLTSILENRDLGFSLAKTKIALLKTMELDDNVQAEDNSIVIVSNESNYEFNDAFARYVFRKPLQRYLNNQFIDDDEFKQIASISEDNLIFSHQINNYLKKRIAGIASAFQNDTVKCLFDGTTANIQIISSNKEDKTVVEGITMNKDIGSKECSIIVMPFLLDIASDLSMSCYSVNNDIGICKIDQTFFGVTISVYTQVRFTNPKE